MSGLVRFSRAVAAIASVAYFPVALALDYTPTEQEWLAWPDYCRARYVVSGAGRDSSFQSRVPQVVVRTWQEQMGPAWEWLHHHCHAVAAVGMARAELDPSRKKFRYEEAIAEDRYMLVRSSGTHDMYATVMLHMSSTFREMKNQEEALRIVDETIQAYPEHEPAYQLKAMLLRDTGDFSGARKVLADGIATVGEGSSDSHYLLGLISLDLGDIDAAMKEAHRVYRLGYPLPGLRQRLEKAGHKLE
jgi:hypothetical protein